MKHTVCENCLDDLEDYTWVYCDDCWQKLCADLKKARPMVNIELEELITTRLGYEAENEWRERCGQSPAYGAEQFQELADRMRNIQNRPKVDEKFICRWAERIWADSNLGIMHIQYLFKAALQAAGVDVDEAEGRLTKEIGHMTKEG